MHDICDVINDVCGGGAFQEFLGNLLIVIGILMIMISLFWDCCQSPLRIGVATAVISALVIGEHKIISSCTKDKKTDPKPTNTPASDDISDRVAEMDTQMPVSPPPPQPLPQPQQSLPQQPQSQPQIPAAVAVPPMVPSTTVGDPPSVPQPLEQPQVNGAGESSTAVAVEDEINFDISEFAPTLKVSAPKKSDFSPEEMNKLKNFLHGAQVAESEASFDRENLDNNFAANHRRIGADFTGGGSAPSAGSRIPTGFFADW